jgi:Lysyl oxidase
MARARLVTAGMAAAAAAVVVALGGSGEAAERPVRLLPDLAQTTPKLLTVTRVDRRWRLGFLSSVRNAGRGPMELRGSRPSTRRARMSARQAILRSDGSTVLGQRVAGHLRYVRTRTHEHWHFLRFMRYELRDTRGRLVAPSRKIGFCLTDSATGDATLPGQPDEPVWTGRCGLRRPGLLTVRAGISVGWLDIYDPFREGQYVDITRLDAGRYVLVHRVDPGRRVLERKRSNNVSSALVRIRWPKGRNARPTVRKLRSCFNSARCPRP